MLLPALYLFVLALELLKRGASGLDALLERLHVEGVAGGLGLGWLMACGVLSGSPVAAVALTLLAGEALSVEESYGMIAGSRLGASFVVLLIGALEDLRARPRREPRSAYVGVTALLATAAIYVPASLLGYWGLRAGALGGLRFEAPGLASLVDAAWGPPAAWLAALLARPALFALGLASLLLAFHAFDAALPELPRRARPVALAGSVSYRPWFMFGVGMAVTALTLSVAVSLSLLVPLAARGYVRRENLWPYVLGANITTFDDTLVVAALSGHPEAVRVVVLLMLAVALLSLPVVLLFPYRFGRALDRAARRVTSGPLPLGAFVACLLLVPLLLIAL